MTTTLDAKIERVSEEYFTSRLAEGLRQAAENDRPYTILAFLPQQLPGERVGDIVKTVEDRVHKLIRTQDTHARLGDDILAVGLANTGLTEARVFAHRLKSDLRLRAARLQNTVWEAGYACLSERRETARELLETAIQAARTRESRLTP